MLTGQLSQELPFIHVVFEGFAPIDEHDGHFIVKLPAQIVVAVDIHFLPGEGAMARQLREALFHHLAQMTSFAGINNDLTALGHAAILPSRPYQLTSKNALRRGTDGHTIPPPA